MNSKQLKTDIAYIIPNLRHRWPKQLERFNDIALASLYEDFAMSSEFGDNDERFPLWFELLPAYDSVAAVNLFWAVARWNAEVKSRPLQNVHRRTLDDTWRQVIRHFGGDPEKLVGPAHDYLADASSPTPDLHNKVLKELLSAMIVVASTYNQLRTDTFRELLAKMKEQTDGQVR